MLELAAAPVGVVWTVRPGPGPGVPILVPVGVEAERKCRDGTQSGCSGSFTGAPVMKCFPQRRAPGPGCHSLPGCLELRSRRLTALTHAAPRSGGYFGNEDILIAEPVLPRTVQPITEHAAGMVWNQFVLFNTVVVVKRMTPIWLRSPTQVATKTQRKHDFKQVASRSYLDFSTLIDSKAVSH